MSRGKQQIKKVLLAVMLIGLVIPFFQQQFEIFELRKLNGSFDKVEKPTLTKASWFDGSYQDKLQKYIEENIGFRNFLVRLNNQLAFWFFNEAKANNVIVGKENYLFEQNYIDAYFGKDFIGDSAIIKKVEKLRYIADTLKTKNIDVVVIIAPGKGDFFPEYIPEKYYREGQSTRNYDVYLAELKKQNINLLDFNAWFKQNKETSQYPLYTKGGIHWSNYGELKAGDSIIHFIEKLKNVSLPQLTLKEDNVSSYPRKTDNDVEKGMNLLYKIPQSGLAYPSFEYTRNENTVDIKSLVVSDSFYWGLYNQGFSAEGFNDGQFWYYNQQIYQPSVGLYNEVIKVNSKKEEIEKSDVVILMATEGNLYRFAFGFIEDIYDEYSKDNILTYAEKVERFKQIIINNPEWFEKMRESAKKDGISLEQQIQNNAEYMVSLENQK